MHGVAHRVAPDEEISLQIFSRRIRHDEAVTVAMRDEASGQLIYFRPHRRSRFRAGLRAGFWTRFRAVPVRRAFLLAAARIARPVFPWAARRARSDIRESPRASSFFARASPARGVRSGASRAPPRFRAGFAACGIETRCARTSASVTGARGSSWRGMEAAIVCALQAKREGLGKPHRLKSGKANLPPIGRLAGRKTPFRGMAFPGEITR